VCGAGQVGDNIASEVGTVILLLFASATLKFHYFLTSHSKFYLQFLRQIVMSSYTCANITRDLMKLDFKLSDFVCDISVLNQF